MSEIATLKKRRAYIKGSMTKLINFINAITSDTNIEDIRARLSNVERYRIEFIAVEDRIVTLDKDEEMDPEFEDNYYKILAGLNRALRAKLEPTISLNDTILDTSANGGHMDVKLPKLSIPFFSGEYTEWQSYHDLFCSTIHDNTRLTSSQKLQYLKGTLKGEAANLLKHFSITDANYIEALKKLRERYYRKRHTIHAFIKNFMAQPSLNTANSANVRQLLDTSDEILRGLKALGDEAESRDHWLIHIMINKLDPETNSLWAQTSADYDLPSVQQFFEFLTKRVDALDSLKCSNKRSQIQYQNPKPVRSHVAYSSQEVSICSLCPQEQHRLFECAKFKNMSLNERRELMRKQNRCFNCLNTNHNVNACKSKFRCRQCNRRHHTLLHDQVPIQAESTVAVSNIQPEEEVQPRSSHQVYTTTTRHLGSAVLPTALVKVTNENNQNQFCRILLDSGSQGSFITEKCAQRLQLKRSSAKLAISGIGATINGYTRGSVSFVITPWNKTKPRCQIDALVFSKLTAKQPSISSCIDMSEFSQYELADPQFDKGAEIDIIIGADKVFEILSHGKVVTKNQLILQNTLLGWVITGKYSVLQPNQSFTITVANPDNDLDNLLSKFWEIENIDTKRLHLSREEELATKCFDDTKVLDKSGRLIVGLPFKLPPSTLGDSYPKAVQRMHSIERKFIRDPEFAASYKEFMSEYLTLGHMKKVSKDLPRDGCAYYLPHHGVIKKTSSTTKLRVVFDGSAKTTTGKSLNDCLAVGPNVQSSLYEILSRFRRYKVAFTADIEKMYRQIRIMEPDTRFQRIIWRDDPNKPFNTYELQTVTYGTASASYLATRAVIEAANNCKGKWPKAVNIIIDDMYIDDLMSGADTIDEALKLKEEINCILASSGFKFRKWLSNERLLNDSVASDIKSPILEIEDSTSSVVKVLGLHWDPIGDCFRFKVSLNDQPTTTKRGILSEASRLFDPLGWLAPITIRVKIFFQTLWTENLHWDHQLPADKLNEWLDIRCNLAKIENITLERYLNTDSKGTIELHGFSDASKQAYSAVVYGKITDIKGKSIVKLLSAKTKVAPVKQLSIPRLELCGALLLTKLILTVKSSLKTEISAIVAWTDSSIVLNWLTAHPNKWNTFVGNRTGEILTHLNRSQWRHVNSQDNPADCASRGLEVDKLKQFSLWWNGPEWLINISNWPDQKINQVTTLELRSQSLQVQISQPNIIDELITKISSFGAIVRVLAYVYRYINLKTKRISKPDVPSYLKISEIQSSQYVIFRHIQIKHFESEIKLIKANKELPVASRIKYFKPFIDDAGLLRVGGRIQNAAITYNIKHPIILTAQDELAEKIVRDHHLRHLHAGPTLMMATLRHKYWILGARNLIKRVIHSCVKCVKYNAVTQNQIMGQLPNPRVELIRPFYKVGVDYAGPFTTYITRGRGQKSRKSYVCIFVCLATKAVHIELVSDLTTDAYLAALKRFIARRGAPTEIHSDNGTNFIGARNHLYQFFSFLKQNVNNVSNFLLTDEISFKLIPPGAPHFGGLWEAAVKSMKFHLRRVTDGHILTIEEMTTLLIDIESMLNSRPICLLSNDDMDYMTPSHFLIGRSSTQLPANDLQDIKLSKLSRWQLIQQMNQHIWRRWQLEYLSSLQHRNKWHKERNNVSIGNIVLIKDNNLPPCKWLMGKIVKLHPGSDGYIRVVTIKTSNGTIKRPIHKLCLLPVN